MPWWSDSAPAQRGQPLIQRPEAARPHPIRFRIGQSEVAQDAIAGLKGKRGAAAGVAFLVAWSMSPGALASEKGAQAGGRWVSAPRPAVARISDFTSSALPDGRVLLVGGAGRGESRALPSAEIFDPLKRRWRQAASMLVARSSHTATVLNDGTVLVAGGHGTSGVQEVLSSAEIYDPSSDTWAPAGDIGRPVRTHTATRLADGRVLLVGGRLKSHLAAHRETSLYDPVQKTWSPGAPLELGRSEHTATLMSNKTVLVAGGRVGGHDESLPDGVIYDPVQNSWKVSGNLMKAGRAGHSATPLPGGEVLIVGGIKTYIAMRAERMLASAELFDPGSFRFRPARESAVPRMFHTASVLSRGKVLVVSGFPAGDPSKLPVSSQIYDAFKKRWQPAAHPPLAPGFHTATVLAQKPCVENCEAVAVVAGSETGKPNVWLFQLTSGAGPAEGKQPRRVGFLFAGALAVAGIGAALALLVNRRLKRSSG